MDYIGLDKVVVKGICRLRPKLQPGALDPPLIGSPG
jgi:hypothetical protein